MNSQLYTCENIGLPHKMVRASAKAGPTFGAPVPSDTMTKLLGFDPKALVARALRPIPKSPVFDETPKPSKHKHAEYMREWRKKNPDRIKRYARELEAKRIAKGLTVHGEPRTRPYKARSKCSPPLINSGAPC